MFCVLLIPAFVESNIYGDDADDVFRGQVQVGGIGDAGKVGRFFIQFYGDPVVGSFVGVLDGFVQCISGGGAAFEVWEVAVVCSVFVFAEELENSPPNTSSDFTVVSAATALAVSFAI